MTPDISRSATIQALTQCLIRYLQARRAALGMKDPPGGSVRTAHQPPPQVPIPNEH